MLAPTGTDELHFLLEDVGPGTHRLCELELGDALHLVGPLGNGFAQPRDGRRALLVGGGVGIAPLAIWQEQGEKIAYAKQPLLGFRDGAHAAGAQLLAGALVATDDGSVGHQGLVTDLLSAELDRDPRVEVYACGPPGMLEAVRALCSARAVPAQLALESGMACGFGACFGCVVPTRGGYLRLCVDGPVLVTGDDVERGKPDPEPYLRAARALGLLEAGRAVLLSQASPGSLVPPSGRGFPAWRAARLLR